MGKLLSSYKKTVITTIAESIAANLNHFYAFAANPVEIEGIPGPISNNDYDMIFTNNWHMMFGKKLSLQNMAPIITHNKWSTNTVYDNYDNTSNTVYENDNYFVISHPQYIGGTFHIYVCVDNANGAASTIDPGSIGEPTNPVTFQTADGYKWKYVTSTTYANYDKFASENYFPVYVNAIHASVASGFAGVDVVKITNGGNGYFAYTEGTVSSVQNSTCLQIESSASGTQNYYANSSIYLYNVAESTSQIRRISSYISNSSGKFVFVNSSSTFDTSEITPAITQYTISPAVVFDTDGSENPRAYSVINTTSYSIQNVVMIDSGSDITWANVQIVANYGSGANAYCIVPPAGGFGSDPLTDLNIRGFGVYFSFTESEANTIPTANVVYNKIGIFRNPYALVANSTTGSVTKGTRFSANTFNNLLVANTNAGHIFTIGEKVRGLTSESLGTVVFSNTTQFWMTGDKSFINGETVANSAGNQIGAITVLDAGDIYVRDLRPSYIENINNINRQDDLNESFKLTLLI